jgi:hypothetical protein
MAGASSISGVGANLGFMPGPDYSPIEKGIASIVAAHDKKKEMGAQEFDRLMKAVDMGLPVDPKQIEGSLKKSGIKLMKPDEMKAHLQAKNDGTIDKLLGGGDTNTTTSDKGVINQDLPGAPQTVKGGASSGGPVGAVAGAKQTQQQAKDSVLKGFVDHAMAVAKLKGETQENQLKLQNKLSDLHMKAANGDAESLGQLMAINEVPFNLQAQAWQKGTPEQKQKMMDVARGAETDAQVAARKDAIYGQLMSDGRFKDPSMGMKAAEVIAKGGELPSDIRNAMVPNTMSDLVKETQLANQLVEMGVPPDQIGTIAANAQKVGLANALPTGMKPLATRQVQAQETRTAVEVARFKAEEAHYQAMAAGMDAKLKEESSRADLEMFKSLVEVKKLSPSAVTDDMISAAQTKAMRAMGWTQEETKGFWNHITGGLIPTTNKSFRPQMTPSGQSKIDASIGGGSTSSQSAQSTVGAIGNSIKKNKSLDPTMSDDNEKGPY